MTSNPNNIYIYAGVALDALILEVQPDLWAATPIVHSYRPRSNADVSKPRTPVNLRRTFPAIFDVPCENRHHLKVVLIVLFTGTLLLL